VLLSVTEQVNLRYGICEFLQQADRAHGPALCSSRRSHSVKVVGNRVGTKNRLALVAFGLRSEEKLLETLSQETRQFRQTAPRQRRTDQKGRATEQATRSERFTDPDLSRRRCRSVHHLRHLTARDPESGLRSMGLHRLQV
jgi:UbiD family decarboxylase